MSTLDEPDLSPSFAAARPLKCFRVEGDDDPEHTMIVFAKTHIEAKRDWANEHGDGDKFIAGISASRQAQWDAFAPGPVPSLELLDAGWWMECHGCGVRISADYVGTTEPYTDHYGYEDWALDREYGPDLTLPVMEPYEPKPGHIWCNKACHDRDMAERARIKRMDTKAQKIVEAWALKKYPGIEIVREQEGYMRSPHASVHRDLDYLLIRAVLVPITFPGSRYGASVSVRDEKWRQSYIINGRPWEPRDGYLCQTTANRAPLSMRKREVELWIAHGDKDAWDAWRATSGPSD